MHNEAIQLRQHWAWETFFVLYKHASCLESRLLHGREESFCDFAHKFTILLRSSNGCLSSKPTKFTDLQVYKLVREKCKESEGHILMLMVMSLCQAHTPFSWHRTGSTGTQHNSSAQNCVHFCKETKISILILVWSDCMDDFRLLSV